MGLYEDQVRVRTSFILSKKPIKQWVAVGKDASMCLMKHRFRNESRQNLGKIPDGRIGDRTPEHYRVDVVLCAAYSA